ncbi:leucine-rich repeat protein 1-like [Varroa destructor]|uniref:PIF1/LRR1 pleckstrin homology domain-containing protein n=1 Tax=Varroa destructor TaxID=109461 RepID=A0A7M7JVG3_VARDE|nr:leucine-rich repeat protein 1-like [Varroa destructor]XP_022653105.1 leucine-rich repeat protein 1-like [Varroa destructor]XP_022653106.1 leucine-rich repeat protein 1-like [Varroa destructor]XP_022653108.1 leucine-rich repeat protein 1-like [Varroa destructor]XP_022653109.1 leucine-rich repeat protein 1-like [Varroa destructor]
MRLSCEAQLSYRKSSGNRRLGQAVITITPDLRNRSEYVLTVTTRQKESGHKYRNLKANIIKVYTSCVREGKLTISLKEPEHDILIKRANVALLENFVKVLHAVQYGLEVPKRFTAQPPTKVQPKITRMVITNRSEYPLRGFPQDLISLRIENIKLSRLQNKIADLSNLTDLAVENNLLEEVPKALATMRLVTLSLQGNKIKKVYDIFSGTLGSTIRVINLSHNEITQIPYSLCRTTLYKLDLSYNLLETLPPSFYGGDQMTVMKLSNNRLRYIPANLRIRNAELTLRGNIEIFQAIQPTRPSPDPMSLFDSAGRAVRQAYPVVWLRITDSAVPRFLYPYLLSFVPCAGCGQPTFPSSQRRTLRQVSTFDFAGSRVYDFNETDMVRKAYILCSQACVRSWAVFH